MNARHDARCDGHDTSCRVCADEAIPGRVVALDAGSRMAVVAFDHGTEPVALDLVDAGVGDRVLVHLGFAIERLEDA